MFNSDTISLTIVLFGRIGSVNLPETDLPPLPALPVVATIDKASIVVIIFSFAMASLPVVSKNLERVILFSPFF
ncbi:hypothetical protein [uncultured Chryseobacterium sp.]|uniref:hypothetical protein n=1 Tax=uncultured Chryseobacterium sp. TaxID=259322 RepID=UPI0025F7406A|nr:hypothetical protein [uncultured Chryseobacterium sp.]